MRNNLASVLTLFSIFALAGPASAQFPHLQIDLAQVTTDTGELLRIFGSGGNGAFGVPIAGGRDCDGDRRADYAIAAMLASPLGRDRAGLVTLVFGNGTIDGNVDTALPDPRVLQIAGSGRHENAGNEIWMDDVTGDGIADLLIGRQNYSRPGRIGNGALSILVGGPNLKEFAASNQTLDLLNPSPDVTIMTIIGGQQLGRMGMWMRSGDVTGDGIADVVVGADQENHVGPPHSGAVYLIRGGPHLASGQTIDLGDSAISALTGHIARIDPPAMLPHLHFGSTCQIGDLDDNHRGEVMIGTALNRASGVLAANGAMGSSADGIGGSEHGSVFILWDDNFPAGDWPADFHFSVSDPPATSSFIDGGALNVKFGEELVGGADYDADGHRDLFVGDLSADLSPRKIQPDSGAAYILYDAASLKGQQLHLDNLPPQVRLTTFAGKGRGDITGDTAIAADYDGDGIDDLLIGSPHATAADRREAGMVHIIYGMAGGWPALIALPVIESGAAVRSSEILGAHGDMVGDDGDVLAYSVATGDIDGDGRAEVIVNEMQGNGAAANAIDVGNLIVVDGGLVSMASDRVECPTAPRSDCVAGVGGSLWMRSDDTVGRLRWKWRRGAESSASEYGDPVSGETNYALCIYDASGGGAPRLMLSMKNQHDCGVECWRQQDRGWRYVDRSTSPDGIDAAKLRTGPGSPSSISLAAQGWTSHFSPSPLQPPVTVQLVAGEAVVTSCWASHYSDAVRDETGHFAARQ